MTEQARNGIVAGAEAASKRLASLGKDGALPPGIDLDYYQRGRIGPPSRRPVQQGTIVDVKALIASDGGADYD